MRHITPFIAVMAAALTFLACPLPGLSKTVSLKLSGHLTEPSVCDGVVYFGSNAGKLYAVNASDGTTVAGFPVDLGVAVGAGAYPTSRPGIYYGAFGKATYVATTTNGVMKVWPNGTVAWVKKLNGGSSYIANATPAVTPQGEVIAGMTTKDNVYLVKLKESDGTLIGTSPPLAGTNVSVISSPAIANGNIYLTIWPFPPINSNHHTAVLDLADLTVKATFEGSGFDKNPPYVRGNGVYVGSLPSSGATVFKLNSATLAPDTQFGAGSGSPYPGTTWVLPNGIGDAPGDAEVCASPASADRDAGGTIYASVAISGLARVVAIDAVTGAVRVLYNTGGGGSQAAVVSTKNVIAYGDLMTLKMFGVDGGHKQSYTLPGYPDRPCYDPTTNRFFVTTEPAWPDGTGASYLLGFDSP